MLYLAGMNTKDKIVDYGISALVFTGGAALLWLFAQAYYPGIQSPMTSLRRLRNVIVVQDQTVGSNVIVSYAALSEPGYVTLKAEAAASGSVLAVSRFLPEGELHNFRIPVEGGLPNGFYYAILRRDDGDERFEPDEDGLVRDSRGAVAITRFLVSDARLR